MTNNQRKRVVITGVGPLSSIGFGKNELWQSVIECRTGLTSEKYFVNSGLNENFYLHKIKNFDINVFGINNNILEDIKAWKGQSEATDLFYLIAVAKLALDDSKLNIKDISKTVGLVLIHENPGLDQFYEDMINESYNIGKESKSKSDYFRKICKRFMKRGYDLQTFMFLFHTARALDIHGYSLFLNNACASGLYAMEAAYDIIKTGKCNAVIIAGADCASEFKYLWFKELGMSPPDGKIKPFAKNRNGFVFGDGGAGVVVESLDNALERRAHIYAEYLGGGFHLEGWKVAIPDMTSVSYKTAIEKAIKNSNVTKEDIDLIIPHGVGTQVTDAYEAKSITSVFGKNPEGISISAFKPYIGHNLGSSALLETVILLLALENDLIPPTLNCDEIDPKLNISLVRKLTKKKLKTVMKTACGFAGYNAAAIFQKLRKRSI